jgi:hypothetical protein
MINGVFANWSDAQNLHKPPLVSKTTRFLVDSYRICSRIIPARDASRLFGPAPMWRYTTSQMRIKGKRSH